MNIGLSPSCSNPPTTSKRTLWAAIGFAIFSLGCQRDQVAHYRVPKESAAPPHDHHDHPDHPGHAEESIGPQDQPGADQPKPSSAPNKGSLKWSLPKGWSESAGSGMRFATFKTPHGGKLEATVVVLPGPAGGELANVNRWRGQIALPDLDEAALAKARTTVKSRVGPVNVYDFIGEGQAKSRMVAGFISTPDGNTWFLKLTGGADSVAKAKPDFITILGSLHLD